MKKAIAFLVLVIAGSLFAQDTGRPITYTNSITVDLDSSTTVKVRLGFMSSRAGKVGLDTVAIDPADQVQWTGDLAITLGLDSLVVSTEFDSLAGYALELDADGTAAGDSCWFDWENQTCHQDSTIEYTSWVPTSRSETEGPRLKINLTNKLAPCFGVEFGLIQAAADSVGTAQAMYSRATVRTAEVK